MAKNTKEIAARLGAEIVGQVPDIGGGVFGAARLAQTVEHQQSRLTPGQIAAQSVEDAPARVAESRPERSP